MIAAVLVVGAMPAVAGAAVAVSYSASTGLLIQGTASNESVVLKQLGDGLPYLLHNGPIPTTFTIGTGCRTSTGGIPVECAVTGNRVVTANLGAGDDSIFAFNTGSPSFADSFIDGGPGNDTLRGGAGNDAIAGGDGNDTLVGHFGADNLNGGDGNDTIGGSGAGDTYTGGAGDDTFSGDGNNGTQATVINGGPGNDTMVASFGTSAISVTADRFDGGSGTDVADYHNRQSAQSLSTSVATDAPNDGSPGELDDLDNVETLIGGVANDTLEVTGPATFVKGQPIASRTLTGNGGNDTLRVIGVLRSTMDGGLGLDTVIGGAATDTIFARDAEADTITCGGSALDSITVDLRDVPLSADCENVDQGAINEGPNVVFASKRLRVRRTGATSVRLTCPKKLKRPCAGRLRARLDKRGTKLGKSVRYSVKPGRSRVVSVSIPAGDAAAARSKGAAIALQSLETGDHGLKTTLRSLRSVRA